MEAWLYRSNFLEMAATRGGLIHVGQGVSVLALIPSVCDNLRRRLKQMICAACGERMLDGRMYHALCCARGESTRGHNDVRDNVFDLARLADATAETETLGLLDTAPGLRPADILTAGAVQGTLAALDVGVTAPSLADGNTDCTAHYRQTKLDKYRRYLPELEAQGKSYDGAAFDVSINVMMNGNTFEFADVFCFRPTSLHSP